MESPLKHVLQCHPQAKKGLKKLVQEHSVENQMSTPQEQRLRNRRAYAELQR